MTVHKLKTQKDFVKASITCNNVVLGIYLDQKFHIVRCNFLIKNKLKSEIFNDKKSL